MTAADGVVPILGGTAGPLLGLAGPLLGLAGPVLGTAVPLEAVLALAVIGLLGLLGSIGSAGAGARRAGGGSSILRSGWRAGAWFTVGARRGADGDEAHEARWATRRDLGPMVLRHPQPGRVVVGRVGRLLVAAEPGSSVLVVGPTQSQKTSGVAIPAILEWPGPVVAASVKADLARHSVGWRSGLGRVWVYDPAMVVSDALATAGAEPVHWTPVDAASTWSGARRAAASLVDSARRGESPMSDGDFWYASAAKLVGPLLHAAAVSGAGITEVLRWLDDQDTDTPAAALSAAAAFPALQAARACWGRDARQRSAVYATAESVLEAYADLPSPSDGWSRGWSGVAEAPRFEPDRLLAGTDTLYLCAPAHHQRRLRPLFTTLVAQVLDAAMDQAERTGRGLDPPLLVIVDEAANIAPLPDLDVLAATASGHGIQLLTVWQDLAQITARYGPRAGTVVNNHRTKLFLSGIADPATLDHAAALVGEHEAQHQTTTVDRQGRASATWAPSRHRLLAPDTLRRLPPGHGVVVSGHRQPCRVRLRTWFADPYLRQRGRTGTGSLS